jgi:hypothetical protein
METIGVWFPTKLGALAIFVVGYAVWRAHKWYTGHHESWGDRQNAMAILVFISILMLSLLGLGIYLGVSR